MANNPLKVYLTWFSEVSTDVQDMVATQAEFFARKIFPTEDKYVGAADIRRALEEGLEEAERGNGMDFVGTLMMAISLTDYTFHGSSTAEHWEKRQKMFEHMLANARAKGRESVQARLEAQLKELPAKAELWIAEAAKWTRVRDEELTPDALTKYLDELTAKAARRLIALPGK